MLNNQKGITLVALVVTIIVLVILATISIALAINSNIIGKAQTAEQWQLNAEARFREDDANTAAYIEQYITNAQASQTTANATGE